MIIVYFDGENVVVINRQNPHTRLEYLWKKDLFESEFNITIDSDIHNFNYEPNNGSYMVSFETPAGEYPTVESFKDPTEHSLLARIHDNITQIEHKSVEKTLVDHTYNSNTDLWKIPQNIKDRKDRGLRQLNRVQELRDHFIDIAEILMLICDGGDIATLQSQRDSINRIIAEYKNEEE